MRHTAFSFVLCPTADQEAGLRRHAGAARFAFNMGLQWVNEAHEARKNDPSVKVPWTGFDLINRFNSWKVSAVAGIDAAGKPGLPWRHEVLAQVFEEAVVDLGRGIQAFFRERDKATKRKTGFPKYRKKGRSRESFRMRNGGNGVRIGVDSVRLPKLGDIRIQESSRRLRRLLRIGPDGMPRGRILFATVSLTAGKWYVRLNVEAAEFHPALTQAPRESAVVGVDRGLKAFAVAATADGTEVWRAAAPKPLCQALKRLRRASRRLSRKHVNSGKRKRARGALGRLHHRIANIRRAHVHNLSTKVAKTHGHVALETLHIAGMLRNPSLARHIADSCWGGFARQLDYKAAWYGCKLTYLDRWAPTSKACCRCGFVAAASLPLSQRVFRCDACGWEADRDTNAGANCARWAQQGSHLAAKQAEKLNAHGGGGAGRAKRGETVPDEVGRRRAATVAACV